MKLPIPVLTEQVLDCSACSLRGAATTPVAGVGQPGGAFFVLEQSSREDELLTEPLSGRAGKLFRRHLDQAGITTWYASPVLKCAGKAYAEHLQTCKRWLWLELKTVEPRVIVALGLTPARLLLKLGSKARLGDLAGSFQAVSWTRAAIAVWHSPESLLHGGRQKDRETIDFLLKVRTHVEDHP